MSCYPSPQHALHRPCAVMSILGKVKKENGGKKKGERVAGNIIKQSDVLAHAVTLQTPKLGHCRENKVKSEKSAAF